MSEEYTLDKCKMLAEKVSSSADLPYACKKYPEAVKAASLKRSGTKNKGAYAGMQGGLAAQATKASGRESHAQIQRRLTNSRRFTKAQ
mmetsp:Transcript_25487/g.36370  ORF Transcript_25487/g.36370 Transcript_25487/m.36370 type:complete len:88 (-) Transcript_25487:195-458(-)